MSIVTRLNPTVNGPLHLGHIYMALINEGVAHAAGGQFIVRFDDSNPFHVGPIGHERMARIMAGMVDDLNWLGIPVDVYYRQSETVNRIHSIVRYHFGSDTFPPEDLAESQQCHLHSGVQQDLYPYAPMLTAEKVIWDHEQGVTHLIRGVDLMTEFSLYQHFCYVARLEPVPRHYYLPRLLSAQGDIRKTLGGQTVADLRAAGYTAGQVRDMVAKACLRVPQDGWQFANLKPEPLL